MKLFPKKAFAVCLQLLFAVNFSFSHQIDDLFFEATRQAVTGCSKNQLAQTLGPISKTGAQILFHSIWNRQINKSVFLYELLQPQKTGAIDSSFVMGSSYLFEDNLWIETTVLSVKAGKDIDDTNDILAMLDGKDDGAFSEDGEEQEIVNLTKDGDLRRYYNDGESFSVSREDAVTKMTAASDKNVVRRTFNEDFRLVKKEVFETPLSSENINLKKEIDYFYTGDGKLNRQEEENKTDKTRTVYFYNDKSKITQMDKSHYEETAASVKARKKNPELEVETELVTDMRKFWSYDDQDRVSAVNSVNYYYSKDSRGKTQVSQRSQKTAYFWGQNSSAPDTWFYENEQLRIKKVYSAETDYTQTLYFEDDMSAVTEYKDEQKVLEIIYFGNVEMRRRTFEVFE